MHLFLSNVCSCWRPSVCSHSPLSELWSRFSYQMHMHFARIFRVRYAIYIPQTKIVSHDLIFYRAIFLIPIYFWCVVVIVSCRFLWKGNGSAAKERRLKDHLTTWRKEGLRMYLPKSEEGQSVLADPANLSIVAPQCTAAIIPGQIRHQRWKLRWTRFMTAQSLLFHI